jgi:hypothetical protein
MQETAAGLLSDMNNKPDKNSWKRLASFLAGILMVIGGINTLLFVFLLGPAISLATGFKELDVILAGFGATLAAAGAFFIRIATRLSRPRAGADRPRQS